MAAVAMLAAVSCNKEITNVDPVTPEADAVVYTAYVDGAQTKTVLGEYDEVNVKTNAKWSGEELITIHDGVKGYTFYTNAAEPSLSAEFTYSGDDFAATEVMAVYPSGEYTADVEAKTVSGVVIPETQTLVAGTYPATAAAAIAYTDNNIVEFKNATALLKFKVAGDDVKFGAFYGVQDVAKLSGTFDVDYNEGDPTVAATAGNHWVNFNLNGEVLSKEAVYYVAIAPGEVENFAVSLNDTEIMKKNGTFIFKRNVIYDLGTITYEAPEVLEWGICGTMTGWGETGDISMTLDGDWYVAEDVAIKTSDAFQFRVGESWTTQKTYVTTKVEADVEYDLVDGSGGVGNITVALSAVYDVFMSADGSKFKIEKVGEVELPEIKEWSVIGSMTVSNWATNILMELDGNQEWYVASEIEMPAGTSFKFRVGQNWDVQLTANCVVSNGVEYTVGSGDNTIVNVAGIYDVYLSRDETKMKVEKVGEYVAPEPDPEPETGVTIYLNPGMWETGGARYEAWIWGDAITAKWVKFTSADNGLYSTIVPEGTTAMKVLRKGSAHVDEAWQSWNDTGDVNFEDGKNQLNITGWNASWNWSVKQ